MAQSDQPNVDELNDEITLRVLERVAGAADRQVTDLSPLYTTVDPDALGALFRKSDGNMRVVFEYEGQTVTVREDGRVAVDENF